MAAVQNEAGYFTLGLDMLDAANGNNEDIKNRVKTFQDQLIAPKLWDELPEDIRDEIELKAFKSKLKTYLFLKF